MASFMPGGCNGAPVTAEEADLIDQSMLIWGEYAAAVSDCNAQYMPAIIEAANNGDQQAMSPALASRNACAGALASAYMPQLHGLVSEMESLCEELSRPIEYPAYTYRSLPPTVLTQLVGGCDQTTSASAEEQALLDEIQSLEDERRESYSQCVNDGRGLIQEAMNRRDPVEAVVSLQDSMIGCVNGVLNAYGQEIDGAVANLQAHCASQGTNIEVTIDEPPPVVEETITESVGISDKGKLMIGGLLLLVVVGGGYIVYKSTR
jgi:hypothetical protein